MTEHNTEYLTESNFFGGKPVSYVRGAYWRDYAAYGFSDWAP